MKDFYTQKLRLLTEENGHRIWRTLEGYLVNGTTVKEVPTLVLPRHKTGSWFVIRTASGKVVVYHRKDIDSDQPGVISIYDSLEAIEHHVPDEVFAEVAKRTSLRPLDTYPEKPLEL